MSSRDYSAPPLQSSQPDASATDSTPDTADTVIIYTDGAYRTDEDLATIGYTLEDNMGNDLEEGWQEAVTADSNMQAEAEAILRAVRLAKDYEPTHVVVSTDCNQLHQHITEGKPTESNDLQVLIDQVQAELDPIDFGRVKSTTSDFTQRAHDLAARGLRELDDTVTDGVRLPTA